MPRPVGPEHRVRRPRAIHSPTGARCRCRVSSVLTNSQSRRSSGAAAPLPESATHGEPLQRARLLAVDQRHPLPGPDRARPRLAEPAAQPAPLHDVAGSRAASPAAAPSRSSPCLRRWQRVGLAERDRGGVPDRQPPGPGPQHGPPARRHLGRQQLDRPTRPLDLGAHRDLAGRHRAEHLHGDPRQLRAGPRASHRSSARTSSADGGPTCWASANHGPVVENVAWNRSPSEAVEGQVVRLVARRTVVGTPASAGRDSLGPVQPVSRRRWRRRRPAGQPGYSGGVPSHAGHSGWWLHHSHIRLGAGPEVADRARPAGWPARWRRGCARSGAARPRRAGR